MRRTWRDAGLAGLLVLFVLPWYFYFGPHPPVVRQILVEGTEKIPPAEISRRLQDFKGTLFSDFFTQKAARTVLKDSRIEKVAVRFAFPNRLVVWVKEKKFDFILSADRLYGLSEKLEIFPLKPEDNVGGKLVISGCGWFNGWYYLPVRTPAMGRLANFLASVRSEYPEFLDKISQLDLEDRNSIKAYFLDTGAEANLGPPPYEPKLTLLKQLLAAGVPAGDLDFRPKNSVYAFVGPPEAKK